MKYTTAITQIKDQQEYIRGFNLSELTNKKTFVETIYLILKGELPGEAETRMLNAMFTSAIDHGPGTPSAQTARITASAKNSLHTALAAGILAMGDLHGSAIEGAAKFFQENKNVADIESLVHSAKERKERILGYGHSVLTHDHRSDSLFLIARQTGLYKEHCVFAQAVGDALNKLSSKPLPLNIDGAMGAIISDMGFDWKLAKGFFIIARVPGLVAHIYEEMTSDDGLRRVPESEIEYRGSESRELIS